MSRFAVLLACTFACTLAVSVSAKTVMVSVDHAIKRAKVIVVGEIAGVASGVTTIRVTRALRGFPPRSIRVRLSKAHPTNKAYVFFLGGAPGKWSAFEWSSDVLTVKGEAIERGASNLQRWGGILLEGPVPATVAALGERVHALAPVAEWSTTAFGQALLAVSDPRPLSEADRKAIAGHVAGLSARRWGAREAAHRGLLGLRAAAVPVLRKAHEAATDAEQRSRLAAVLETYRLIDKARPLAGDLTVLRRWSNHPEKALRDGFRARVAAR